MNSLGHEVVHLHTSGAFDTACRGAKVLRSCCQLLAIVLGGMIILSSCCLALGRLASRQAFLFSLFFYRYGAILPNLSAR